MNFCDLLYANALIDKSQALHYLLNGCFNHDKGDFFSTPLRLVYPRRFAKTTLLGFIEAVFSPLPKLNGYSFEEVKMKIASLSHGKDLLEFGMHPIVWLDFQEIDSVDELNRYIALQLQQAGLENFTVDEKLSPKEQLRKGIYMLNDKFLTETGVESKTMVLIDKHDKPFRKNERTKDHPLLSAIVALFALGKDQKSGISLTVFCGLTRMVGSGLSSLNNLVDISSKSEFHGLCGISAKEFVDSCSGELSKYSKDGNFEVMLKTEFAPKWNGFRFGLDKAVGNVSPDSPEGALFSPLDVWEIVLSLARNLETPTSRWIQTMEAQFEFTSFSRKYTQSEENLIDLFRNLEGGLVDTKVSTFTAMEREDYMLLATDLHVQRVLFELGLLSVKEVRGGGIVVLGSPNALVTDSATMLLAKKAQRGFIPASMAQVYMSEEGFGHIVSRAATELSNTYRETGIDGVNEFLLQSYLTGSCHIVL